MNRLLFFLVLISTLFFSSCLMQKVEYVKDMVPDSLYKIKASEALKIQPDDRLAILVNSENIGLAAPFNAGKGKVRLTSEVDLVTGINSNNDFEEGYLVDKEGNIKFPVLGNIHVADLSMEEISNLIVKMLKDNNYLVDPEVKVNLLNFKVMVMGNLKNSIYNIPDGKITLLEAIVRAGGLNADSDASEVMVIREEGAERKMLIANMQEYEMFNSEAYYLKQNDIVYIKPKYKRLSPGTQNVWQVVGMLFGVVSLSLSAVAIFSKK